MKVLPDTHALLWFGLSDARLSDGARSLIRDPDNQPLVSPASYWEIAIKISLGKYRLFQDLASFMEQQIGFMSWQSFPSTRLSSPRSHFTTAIPSIGC